MSSSLLKIVKKIKNQKICENMYMNIIDSKISSV